MFKFLVSPTEANRGQRNATRELAAAICLTEVLQAKVTDCFLSPIAQWHQWLRYVRPVAPTLEEQRQDLVRQAQMKELARLADERWASKPSFLDKPKTQQSPGIESGPAATASNTPDSVTSAPNAPSPQTSTTKNESATPKTQQPNPWAKADRQNPGESWQPDAWTPNSQR